ncbi:MAG: type II secretion system F family protein [Actinomycetota bacterium]
MGWQSLLIGVSFGIGILLIYDALVRPDGRLNIRGSFRRLGPRGAGGAAGVAVALLLTGWVVAAIAAGLVGWLLPSILTRGRSDRERVRRMEAIAELAARLRDSIRSGIGIHDGIAQASDNPPSAIAREVKRLAADSRVSGLGPASNAFATRLGAEGELMAAALSLGEEAGARNLSDVLDALAEASSARAGTLREARARQARARVSARVVAAVPLVLLILIRRTNPGYLAPFDAAQGQVVLAFAIGLVAFGYLMMLKVARLEKTAS